MEFGYDTAFGVATTFSVPVLERLPEQVVPDTVLQLLFYIVQKLNLEKGKTLFEALINGF